MIDPDGREPFSIAATGLYIGCSSLVSWYLVNAPAITQRLMNLVEVAFRMAQAGDATAKGTETGSRGSQSNNSNNKAPKNKPVNLPSWKKVSIDMDHIASGHMEGGSRVSDAKSLFPSNMSEKQVESAIREAYRLGEKIATQGDRVLMRGTSNGVNIEMWVNKVTKTIETAYPIGQ